MAFLWWEEEIGLIKGTGGGDRDDGDGTVGGGEGRLRGGEEELKRRIR